MLCKTFFFLPFSFNNRFEQVFSRSLSYIAIPELQSIPMTLLRKFASHIDQGVLDTLKQNLEVFEVKFKYSFLFQSLLERLIILIYI